MSRAKKCDLGTEIPDEVVNRIELAEHDVERHLVEDVNEVHRWIEIADDKRRRPVVPSLAGMIPRLPVPPP